MIVLFYTEVASFSHVSHRPFPEISQKFLQLPHRMYWATIVDFNIIWNKIFQKLWWQR